MGKAGGGGRGEGSRESGEVGMWKELEVSGGEAGKRIEGVEGGGGGSGGGGRDRVPSNSSDDQLL